MLRAWALCPTDPRVVRNHEPWRLRDAGKGIIAGARQALPGEAGWAAPSTRGRGEHQSHVVRGQVGSGARVGLISTQLTPPLYKAEGCLLSGDITANRRVVMRPAPCIPLL